VMCNSTARGTDCSQSTGHALIKMAFQPQTTHTEFGRFHMKSSGHIVTHPLSCMHGLADSAVAPHSWPAQLVDWWVTWIGALKVGEECMSPGGCLGGQACPSKGWSCGVSPVILQSRRAGAQDAQEHRYGRTGDIGEGLACGDHPPEL